MNACNKLNIPIDQSFFKVITLEETINRWKKIAKFVHILNK